MDNLEFELHKVKREIKRHGEEYIFYRREKNEFGEATGEESEIKVLKGLYHEERGYVKLETDDGANIKSKPEPQLLCIIEYEKVGEDKEEDGEIIPDEGDEETEAERLMANVDLPEDEEEGTESEEVPPDDGDIEEPSDSDPTFSTEVVQGDYVKIRGVTYKVVTVVDIQNYGIIANISLELVV